MIPVMIMLYGTIYENIDSEEVVYTIGLNYQVSENEKAQPLYRTGDTSVTPAPAAFAAVPDAPSDAPSSPSSALL